MQYWEKGELGKFVTLKRGFDLPQQKRDSGEVPIFSSSGITGMHSKTMVKAPGVITGRYGTIGQVFFSSKDFWPLNTTLFVEDFHGNDEKFVYYFLKTLNWENFASASAVPGINRNTVHKELVCFPDIKSQKKIAGILSLLDDKIETNQNINDNLELQAQSLVTEYIEKTPYTTHLSDIMTFDNGFTFQSKTYLKQGKYKIITIKNVQDGRIDSTGTAFINELPQRVRENCILSIGDILLSLTGNVGRVGIVYEKNLLLNQRVARVVPFDKRLLPFLYFVFRQPSIKTQLEMIAKGTAQLNLSPIEALNLTISYEQSSATVLSQSLEALYKIIISNQQENLLLAQLRDTLLPKLMSGKIDVSSVQL